MLLIGSSNTTCMLNVFKQHVTTTVFANTFTQRVLVRFGVYFFDVLEWYRCLAIVEVFLGLVDKELIRIYTCPLEFMLVLESNPFLQFTDALTGAYVQRLHIVVRHLVVEILKGVLAAACHDCWQDSETTLCGKVLWTICFPLQGNLTHMAANRAPQLT